MNSTYMFDFLHKHERKHLLACFIILKAFQVFLGRVALTSNNDFHYFIGLKTINMPPFPVFFRRNAKELKKKMDTGASWDMKKPKLVKNI